MEEHEGNAEIFTIYLANRGRKSNTLRKEFNGANMVSQDTDGCFMSEAPYSTNPDITPDCKSMQDAQRFYHVISDPSDTRVLSQSMDSLPRYSPSALVENGHFGSTETIGSTDSGIYYVGPNIVTVVRIDSQSDLQSSAKPDTANHRAGKMTQNSENGATSTIGMHYDNGLASSTVKSDPTSSRSNTAVDSFQREDKDKTLRNYNEDLASNHTQELHDNVHLKDNTSNDVEFKTYEANPSTESNVKSLTKKNNKKSNLSKQDDQTQSEPPRITMSPSQNSISSRSSYQEMKVSSSNKTPPMQYLQVPDPRSFYGRNIQRHKRSRHVIDDEAFITPPKKSLQVPCVARVPIPQSIATPSSLQELLSLQDEAPERPWFAQRVNSYTHLACVVMFCCNPLFGIVALVMSVKSSRLGEAGDYIKAHKYSKLVLIISILGVMATGIAACTCLIIFWPYPDDPPDA